MGLRHERTCRCSPHVATETMSSSRQIISLAVQHHSGKVEYVFDYRCTAVSARIVVPHRQRRKHLLRLHSFHRRLQLKTHLKHPRKRPPNFAKIPCLGGSACCQQATAGSLLKFLEDTGWRDVLELSLECLS